MEIILRKANKADAELVYPWRNAEIVRRNAFNQQKISLNDHIQWFNEALKNKDLHLLIAEFERVAVGVLRIDMMADEGLINLYINPDEIGKGIGTAILTTGIKWVKQHFPSIKLLHAKILMENKASMRAFEKANFKPQYINFINQL